MKRAGSVVMTDTTEGFDKIKRRKILKSTHFFTEEDDNTNSGDGFTSFMTRVNTLNANTHIKQVDNTEKDYILKSLISIEVSNDLLKAFKVDSLMKNNSLIDSLSWFQYPDTIIENNLIRNRVQKEVFRPSSNFLNHQRFRNNFGLQQTSHHVVNEVYDDLFKSNIEKKVNEQETLFKNRVEWSQRFLELNRLSQQSESEFYVVEQKQYVLITTKKVIISSSSLMLRRNLKNYGVKFSIPFQKKLEETSNINNMSELERITEEKTISLPTNLLQRSESIFDGTETSLLVVKGELNVRLFSTYYMNSICKREGTHSLPLLYSYQEFHGATKKKPKLFFGPNYIKFVGIFVKEQIQNFKKHLIQTLKVADIKLSAKNEAKTKRFNSTFEQ